MKLLLSLLLLAPVALASKRSVTQAEVRRLADECEKLAGKGAWSGVERTYVQLLALERKGGVIGHDQHVLAAHAAQNRGDPLTTWERLKAAADVEMQLETLSWKADIEATYSRFEVTVAPGYAETFEITTLDPLFDPVHKETVARFAKELIEQRHAHGLLPLGRYRIADDVVLESYGGDTQKVTLRPRGSVVADPTITTSTIAVLPNTVLSLQVAADINASDWAATGPALEKALKALPGIESVEVIKTPPLWHYITFNPTALAAIEVSPASIRESVCKTFELTEGQVTLGDTQVVVASSLVPKLSKLALTEVLIQQSPVPIDAIARLRTAPGPDAKPAGIDVLLLTGSDRVGTTRELHAITADPAFAPLELQIRPGGQ